MRRSFYCMLAALSMAGAPLTGVHAQDAANPPAADGQPAGAEAGGPGTIMDMILEHQAEREREAAELEDLRRRNAELVEQMRREALAIDLIIAEAHARHAGNACRLATETEALIDRQIAVLEDHLAEIDARCAEASDAEQVTALCSQRRAETEAEIARLATLDTTPPVDCGPQNDAGAEEE